MPLSAQEYAALPRLPLSASGEIPPRFTLERYLPSAQDQGKSSACTSYAATSNKAYRIYLFGGQRGTPDDALQSPAFVYNGVTGNCRGGTTIPSNIQWMAKHGSIPADRMRFDGTLCEDPSRFQPGSNPSSREIDALDSNPSLALGEIKAAIAAGDPVISLIHECREFKSAWGRNYIPAVDQSDDDNCGFHSILLVGYDDDARAVRILNSWGPDWGKNGKVWMDYSAFKTRYLEGYVDLEPRTRSVRYREANEGQPVAAQGRPDANEISAQLLAQSIRSNIGKVIRTGTNKDGTKVEWREWNLWLDLPKRYSDQIDSAEYTLHDDTFPHPFKVSKRDSSLLMITWSGYDCVDAGTVRVKMKGQPSVYGNFDHCELEQTQKPMGDRE